MQFVRLAFDAVSGHLRQVTNRALNVSIAANASLRYYISYDWIGAQESGAYIFRPRHQQPEQFSALQFSYVTVCKFMFETDDNLLPPSGVR